MKDIAPLSTSIRCAGDKLQSFDCRPESIALLQLLYFEISPLQTLTCILQFFVCSHSFGRRDGWLVMCRHGSLPGALAFMRGSHRITSRCLGLRILSIPGAHSLSSSKGDVYGDAETPERHLKR